MNNAQKKTKRIKYIVIAIATLILVLILYTVIWFVYYYRVIYPFEQDDSLKVIEQGRKLTLRSVDFERENICGSIDVATPGFGTFAGNVSIIQGVEIDENGRFLNDYSVRLTISLGITRRYEVVITSYNDDRSADLNQQDSYRYSVDKDLNLLDESVYSQDEIELFESQKKVLYVLHTELMERFSESSVLKE